MKLNYQVCYFFGLNYKFFWQKKVVLEGDEEIIINYIYVIGCKCCGG